MADFCNTPSFLLGRSPTFLSLLEIQIPPCYYYWTYSPIRLTFYELIDNRISMADADLLTELFLQEGRKQGLDEELLREVLILMIRDQFIPKGKRSSVQSELERLVKQCLKEE
jgi:hypothetical protein